MATYEVELTARARKQYEALDRPVRTRVGEALAALASDPAAAQAKALTGQDGLLRIRVGAWRVIYMVDHGRVLVVVFEIGHRSTICRHH